MLKLDNDAFRVQVDKVVPYVQGLPESTMVGWINCDGEPHRTEGMAGGAWQSPTAVVPCVRYGMEGYGAAAVPRDDRAWSR